jgi:ribosomal protein S6
MRQALMPTLDEESLKETVEKFEKRAVVLAKEVQDFISTGKKLLEKAIKKADFKTFHVIVYWLYFAGPRGETIGLKNLDGYFKEYPNPK